MVERTFTVDDYYKAMAEDDIQGDSFSAIQVVPTEVTVIEYKPIGGTK